MKTNTMVLGTKANALSKVRREKMSRVKLIRANFMLGLSIFANVILSLLLDIIDFTSLQTHLKLASLFVVISSYLLTIYLCNKN